MPMEEGVTVIGSSSDHTIVDVTDSPKKWKSGDTMTFRVQYGAMLYAFTGKHVAINFTEDDNQ